MSGLDHHALPLRKRTSSIHSPLLTPAVYLPLSPSHLGNITESFRTDQQHLRQHLDQPFFIFSCTGTKYTPAREKLSSGTYNHHEHYCSRTSELPNRGFVCVLRCRSERLIQLTSFDVTILNGKFEIYFVLVCILNGVGCMHPAPVITSGPNITCNALPWRASLAFPLDTMTLAVGSLHTVSRYFRHRGMIPPHVGSVWIIIIVGASVSNNVYIRTMHLLLAIRRIGLRFR
jgi:hypothetical protein